MVASFLIFALRIAPVRRIGKLQVTTILDVENRSSMLEAITQTVARDSDPISIMAALAILYVR